ncbi:MAG: 30S ribosomal protein S4 [Candidatus Levybacteria bacterium]|nr:30S ribosomal protein S4 [Candidatus Levybacteria bacterium]
MARYTGPKHKLARREGVNILDKTSTSLQRRLNIPPGIHGAKRKRRLSEYGQQLREKQKLKATYGLLERQLKRLVKSVQKKKGETGEMLISLLETRLDNVVYRLGFAKTRFQARQIVTHGHVLVNSRKLNICSYQVKKDDIISVSSKTQGNQVFKKIFEEKTEILPFLERKGTFGKLVRFPKKSDLEVPFSTQLIIEYYSR